MRSWAVFLWASGMFSVAAGARAEETAGADVPPVDAPASAAPASTSTSSSGDNAYRLRADVYGRADPGIALLSVQGAADSPWVTAEVLVWGGFRDDVANEDLEGDALVALVRVHDPEKRAELSLGRFVASLGAIRPVHLDGGALRVRLPFDFVLEAYGGAPVVPRFGERDFDWAVGSRVSRTFRDGGSAGVAFQHRRDRGSVENQEIGFDGGAPLADWLDVSARLAYDLVHPGVSEARAVLAAHRRPVRAEIFGTHQSPSRLLPATSLFSVLGDVASQRFGGNLEIRAAPRLDLQSTAAVRMVGSRPGESILLAGVLRFDDLGASAMRIELRREGIEDGSWTGVRATLRAKLPKRLAVASELELVKADDPRGRGRFWPWGLVGLTWQPLPSWQLAGAFQASTSPEFRSRLDGIVRVTYVFERSRR